LFAEVSFNIGHTGCQQGWKKLMSEVPGEYESCLQYFAKAVEIDEVACGWKTKFEERLELIGDLFSLDLTEQQDIYHSMIAEAYLVLLLYTVVDLYGKPSMDVEEDYRCCFCKNCAGLGQSCYPPALGSHLSVGKSSFAQTLMLKDSQDFSGSMLSAEMHSCHPLIDIVNVPHLQM
jgi:hypothetical protein